MKNKRFRCAVKSAGEADFAPSERPWSQARKAVERLQNLADRRSESIIRAL
jgi:hypothetical protein